MRLTHPLMISARLLPALRFGDATSGFSYLSWSWSDYCFYLDTPTFEYVIDDFRPGACADTQQCFASIFSFMDAAAESRGNRERRGGSVIGLDSNENLFSPHIVDWIIDNGSEISCLAFDLEEGPQLIEEAA